MNCVTPVVNGLEPYESKIGGPEQGQPEFLTLHSLCSPEGKVMSRWEPTPEERQAIADGADVYLTIHTGNKGYPPTSVQVMRADECAEYVKATLNLDDALQLKMLMQDLDAAVAAFEERKKCVMDKRQEIIARLQATRG
jgi:hypothetical protein